jgi:hypothetical protein
LNTVQSESSPRNSGRVWKYYPRSVAPSWLQHEF